MLIPSLNSGGSVKDFCIFILSEEWPLTARKIYNQIKKQGVSVTYQAIFKALRELVNNSILLKRDMQYEINLHWLNYLHEQIEKIKLRYMIKHRFLLNSTEISKVVYNFDPRIMRFGEEIGPKAEEFLEGDKGCILGLGGNAIFGLALKNYLKNKGIDITFEEVEDRKEPHLSRDTIENRKVIVVDGAIYTGGSYRRIMDKLNSLRKKYNILGIKYAVEYDMMGLADWSCESNRLENSRKIAPVIN